MRRPFFLVPLVAFVAICLVVPGVAFANFGPHGGYEQDTDSCAGCHRAHTSFSSIKLSQPTSPSRYALLVGSGDAVFEFCYACHDNTSQGAETNVDAGVYEGTDYGQNGARLNGGLFGQDMGLNVTSRHMSIGYNGIVTGTVKDTMPEWAIGAYGGGLRGQGSDNAFGSAQGPDAVGTTKTFGDCGTCHDVTANFKTWGTVEPPLQRVVGMSDPIKMSCIACHDPHGSSNYRLLKDVVNGNLVGDAPGGALTPFVTSIETSYPPMGWLLHEDGASQMATYEPNYTTELYARAPSSVKGISGWCAGCHSTYLTWDSAGQFKADWDYDEGDKWKGAPVGRRIRHRHPVNVALSEFNGLGSPLSLATTLPLGHDAASENPDNVTNDLDDELNCMSCHVAHGSDEPTPTGYASRDVSGTVFLQHKSSVLLRLPNYGVCQSCHNK